jgi:hypothetical protein
MSPFTNPRARLLWTLWLLGFVAWCFGLVVVA